MIDTNSGTQDNRANRSMENWWRNQAEKYKWVFYTFGAVLNFGVAMLIKAFPLTVNVGRITTQLNWIVPLTQCILLFFFLFYKIEPKQPYKPNEEADYDMTSSRRMTLALINSNDLLRDANNGVQRFRDSWYFVCMAWIVLYATLTIKGIIFHEYTQVQIKQLIPSAQESYWFTTGGWSILINFLNNLGAVAFFNLYFITSKRIFNDTSNEKMPVPPWFGIIAGLTFLEVLYILVIPHNPSDPYPTYFAWVSGILSGICIALFIGRIESNWVMAPGWVIRTLYFYAALQPAFASFPGNDYLQSVFTSLALLCKVVLFATVYWMVQSGVMLWYTAQVYIQYVDDGKARHQWLNDRKM